MRAFLAALPLIAACHTHEVAKDDRKMGSAPEEGPPKQREVSSPRPVRTTPGGFLDDKSMRKIQQALSDKGEPVRVSGVLDAGTQAALRRFQAREKQPTTGYPDFGTLKLLGLDARDIYLGGAERQK